jgi:predicted dehydrogenase
MTRKITRREALQTGGVLAAGVWLGGSPSLRAEQANDRLNLACIGIGGQGGVNLNALAKQNIVALCDVDQVRAGKNFERFPKARRFVDFRQMFDKMEKEIDAVVISTPDHTHFHPTYMAMQRRKHVFVEKPLAHNVWQARQLTELARKNKLATQLGVQRHTIPNMARVVELIRARAIGEVTEVHSWISSSRGMPADPKEYPAVPKTLDWDLWLGPAAETRYSPAYAPYNWRFWWDFGTGEAGNWGCHILDIPYWALDLKYPTRVAAVAPKPDPRKTPTTMTTRFEFPASKDRPLTLPSPPAVGGEGRVRGGVTLFWYQIGSPPILKEKGLAGKGANTVFIGTKGILVCGFNTRQLYPIEQYRDYKAPAASIKPSPGFHREWLDACKGGRPATCNFDYSGPMTETVLLANAAYRAGGEPFTWDGEKMTATGNKAVTPLLREAFRKGWEI